MTLEEVCLALLHRYAVTMTEGKLPQARSALVLQAIWTGPILLLLYTRVN